MVNSPEGALTNEAVEKSGVFYASNALFFQSVWEYCKTVNRIDVAGELESQMVFAWVRTSPQKCLEWSLKVLKGISSEIAPKIDLRRKLLSIC